MKILLCTNTYLNVGNGPTKFARLLYSSSAEDFEVHILSEDLDCESERLHKCKVTLPFFLFWLGPIWRMIVYYRQARILNRKYNFNCVIYNNSIFGVLHALFSAKTIGMINDSYLVQEDTNGLQLSKYDVIKRHVFKKLEGFSIRQHRIILTNSRFLNDLFRQTYPAIKDRFYVLYKGIQPGPGTINDVHVDLSLGTDPIKVLFVKNNFRLGGLENLIQALSEINVSFLLTVIGPDSSMEHFIRKMLKPNINLQFLGRQSQERVYQELLNHHLFCVPSHMEALGVANLEALSVGIPVVASDAGGIPEAVSDGQAAFLTKAGCVSSLKAGLLDCISNRELRNEKVKIGLKDVKNFHFDNTIARLKQIVAEL